MITGMVIVSICLQLSLHPSNTNAWVEIYDYSVVFREYPDNIQYEDLILGNEQELVAATVKYHDSLPDRVMVIKISNRTVPFDFTEEYWAELKDNAVSYDNRKILLKENNGTILLVTHPNDSERREYVLKVKNIEDLFEVGWSEVGPYGDKFLSRSAHDFKLMTGAEKVFAKMLTVK
jgi:hypothetical protein